MDNAPYSKDIHERILADAGSGETARSETGDWRRFLGKIGGQKKRVLSGANADWIGKRTRSGPVHLAQAGKVAGGARGKTDVRAVLVLASGDQASFLGCNELIDLPHVEIRTTKLTGPSIRKPPCSKSHRSRILIRIKDGLTGSYKIPK